MSAIVRAVPTRHLLPFLCDVLLMFLSTWQPHLRRERRKRETISGNDVDASNEERRNEGNCVGKKPLVFFLIREDQLRRGCGFPRATPSSSQAVPESRRRAEASAMGRRTRRASEAGRRACRGRTPRRRASQWGSSGRSYASWRSDHRAVPTSFSAGEQAGPTNGSSRFGGRPPSISSDTPHQQELLSGTESSLDGGRGDFTCKA
jgi:hypothetical protein